MNEIILRLLKRASESIRGGRVLLKENLASQSTYAAYYAMFYVAQALLLSRGQSFSRHSAVIGHFGQEFSKTQMIDPIYQRYLHEGFNIRQIAYYGITENIDRKEASELIRRADKFLREAKSFLSEQKSK